MHKQFCEDDISVIIPTYNSAQTIETLLKSIIEQKPFPKDIMIIDDCSADETTNIVKKYPVNLIRQDVNSGPAKARNRGIKEAKGDIILFLDSDTYLKPNAIRSILDGFNNRENVYAQNGICDSDPLNRGWAPSYKALVESAWADSVHDWDNCSKCVNARVGAFIKKTLIEAGGFDENYHRATVEDHEFGIRYTKKYKIFTNKSLIVRHHFPNFLKTVRNYWTRTQGIMELTRLNKGMVSTTGGVSYKSSIQHIVASALLVLPFFSIFSYTAWIVWFFFFITFIVSSGNILKRLFSKGFLFGIYGTVLHAIYGLVIIIAAISYYAKLIIKNKTH